MVSSFVHTHYGLLVGFLLLSALTLYKGFRVRFLCLALTHACDKLLLIVQNRTHFLKERTD